MVVSRVVLILGTVSVFFTAEVTSREVLNGPHISDTSDVIRVKRDFQVRCKLNLQDDLDHAKEPLFIKRSDNPLSELLRPEVENNTGVIYLEEGQEILLACTGKGNVNSVFPKATTVLGCSNGVFTLEGRLIPKEQLRSSLSCVKTYICCSLKILPQGCGGGGNNGTIIQLGFEVDTSWLPQVELCHNIDNMATLYVLHKLYGSSLAGAIKTSIRKSFCVGDKRLYQGVDPEKLYTQDSQQSALDVLLGPGAGNKYIVKNRVYFARGHLAPDADFIYNSEQQMTYCYCNAAPQWQPFNNANWKRLEYAFRALAIEANATLDVYTGTYAVTKLPDMDNVEQEIFLESTRKVLPAPEVYWKFVHHPVTKACTVAVGVNNVYLTSPPATLCPPVQPRGWPVMPDLDKGYTYYCSYDDFRLAVPYVPDVDCTSLFEFKSA